MTQGYKVFMAEKMMLLFLLPLLSLPVLLPLLLLVFLLHHFVDPKKINTPICFIVTSTNQRKAIIQVSKLESSGFDIELENF
jgi:hypothetical protein